MLQKDEFSKINYQLSNHTSSSASVDYSDDYSDPGKFCDSE